MRNVRGHVVTLIWRFLHIVECNPGGISNDYTKDHSSSTIIGWTFQPTINLAFGFFLHETENVVLDDENCQQSLLSRSLNNNKLEKTTMISWPNEH